MSSYEEHPAIARGRRAATEDLERVTQRAPDILQRAAETFRERNAVYGDNYLRFGRVFRSMFPNGEIHITTDEEADRLQLLMQIVNKCTRYAEQLNNGGHFDSALDMSVYAAMLAEKTDV